MPRWGPLYTCEELAEHLKLDIRTVMDKRWRLRVGLESIRLGGRVLFRDSDVQKVLDRHRQRIPAGLA